jgi:hypothetical protein
MKHIIIIYAQYSVPCDRLPDINRCHKHKPPRANVPLFVDPTAAVRLTDRDIAVVNQEENTYDFYTCHPSAKITHSATSETDNNWQHRRHNIMI